MKCIKEISLFLKKDLKDFSPKVGVILGSGLGYFIDSITVVKKVAYKDIPYFPQSTAPGHMGNLVFGYFKELPIVVMQGRFHYYEGYSMDEITFPVRLLKELGIETLVITNASGGINLGYAPGNLVVIKDHINYSGINPLVGNSSLKKHHFIDMTYTYDVEYRNQLNIIFKNMGIPYREGVYLYTTGPSYETPSEINAFRILGADCVGMSTVPEVVVARDEELRVVGISCISNMAAGVLDSELTEEEVLNVAASVSYQFTEVLCRFLEFVEQKKN